MVLLVTDRRPIMTIVPVRSLTPADLRRLGRNIQPDPRGNITRIAIDRSLAAHGEQLGDDDDIEALTESEALAS
jgi:hypothetical protein